MLRRHAVVHPTNAEKIKQKFQTNGWLLRGIPFYPIHEAEIGIPLSKNSPNEDSEIYFLFPEVIRVEQIERKTLNKTLVEKYISKIKHLDFDKNSLPPHDIIGDLLIFRLAGKDMNYLSPTKYELLTIASQCIMEEQKRIRASFIDLGVGGEMRIRKLKPVLARIKDDFFPAKEENNQKLFNTETKVKESGIEYYVDLTKAYYNSRLSSERNFAISVANGVFKKLNRPIDIADPYCGVGPTLIALINSGVPIRKILANDINSNAIKLAKRNLNKWKINLMTEQIDANKLKNNDKYDSAFDFVVVNLPRTGLKSIQSITHLLREQGVIVAWIHATEMEKNLIKNKLENIKINNNSKHVVEMVATRSFSGGVKLFRCVIM